MLLQAVRATNNRGSVVNLPLEDISAGFVVMGIEGLGPVKANLVSSSFANMDGEQYHSSRREGRDIVLKLGLDPDFGVKSVHALREQLYDFFMPKSKTKLTFTLFDKFSENVLDATLELDIEGRIETCEPDMFTINPTLEVTIRCFDPDFVNLDEVIFAGNSTSGLLDTIVPYKGTVETGVLFTFRPNRNMNDFTIYHRNVDEMLRTTEFWYPMVPGDLVEINSVYGEKRVTITRAGVQSSILYALSPQSAWLELSPGDNKIRVYSAGAAVPYDIKYTTKYGAAA